MRKIKYRWSDEDLLKLVPECSSLRQILLKLNLTASGANYLALPKRIKELGLSTSHFLGRAHLKFRTHTWNSKYSLKDILVEDSSYNNTSTLKRRLLKANLLKYKCFGCDLTEWNTRVHSSQKKLNLQLDHINGIRSDNRLENLRLLCPNCHSMTDNFAGRNIGKNKPL